MSRTKKIFRRSMALILALILTLITLIIWSDWTVRRGSRGLIYSCVDSLPHCKAAIILGTAKHLGGGYINPYFANRIEAGAELYHAGKVEAIVVSGDNSTKNYNEPEDMKMALIERGVPAEVIYLDYAGFRTLDSIIRMREIFGQERFIVVSQQFHNQRAIYIARHNAMQAYGYNATDVSLRAGIGMKSLLRERLARVKLFIDIAIGKEPKFLGEKVKIGSAQSEQPNPTK